MKKEEEKKRISLCWVFVATSGQLEEQVACWKQVCQYNTSLVHQIQQKEEPQKTFSRI